MPTPRSLLAALLLSLGGLLQAQGPTLAAAGGESLYYTMSLWGEAFQARHPGTTIAVRVEGEDKAFGDMTRGSVQMAMLARDALPEEVADFTRRWGYPPTRIALAMDALVWVVHRDNPIQGLTIEQLDAIFEEGQQLVRGAGQAPLSRDILQLNLLKVTDRFDADARTLR